LPRSLLREETVEAEIERKRRLIRLLNPELGLINTRDPIPLYVAASGPRARSLTAKLGAGWIATAGDVEGGVAAIADMRQRRRPWSGPLGTPDDIIRMSETLSGTRGNRCFLASPTAYPTASGPR
jgi:hypothetical protein